MKIKVVITVGVLFFLYLFLSFNTNFYGPDMPIYYAYTHSIVEDGDLNLADFKISGLNIPRFRDEPYCYRAKGVSKTYNFPGFHSHGGIIMWVPFYLYGKVVSGVSAATNILMIKELGTEKVAWCVLSFSTICFGFLAAVLTYFLCRIFFSQGIALWSTMVIVLATPFLYYTVYHPGNANIIAILFSILSIWIASWAMEMKRWDWFLYGVFFSICLIIKVDLWFQIIFIAFIYIVLLIGKKVRWVHGMYFIIGMLPGLFLKGINDYLKYGVVRIGELGVTNIRNYYIWDKLFHSYRGIFYKTPVLWICLAGFILVSIYLAKNWFRPDDKKKYRDCFIFILGIVLWIKISFLVLSHEGGGGLNAPRKLLTELPILVLLFARAFPKRNIFLRILFIALSLAFITWNLIISCEPMTGDLLRHVREGTTLMQRLKDLPGAPIFPALFGVKDVALKLKFCLPLLVIIFLFVPFIYLRVRSVKSSDWYLRESGRYPLLRKGFILFSLYLLVAYMTVTGLNLVNNGKNVERLKKSGYFNGVRIISPDTLEKEDKLEIMDDMIRYFTIRGELKRVEEIREYKRINYGVTQEREW